MDALSSAVLSTHVISSLSDPPNEPSSSPTLAWTNVAIGLGFILFNAGVSSALRLGIGLSLLIAALRCIGQLAVVATILQGVFERKDPWTVAGIVFILNLLGTIETVVNKSPRRFCYMFPTVLVAMLVSTIPIGILGTKFSMSIQPFWMPIQFIPVVGMLTGASISGMTVALSYILKEFQENRDKVEIYLAFGASRLEACRPIAVQALKLALTPPINTMSVLGIISIPGMMTGAILGGSSVQQAARLQMIIMFMISASTTLSSVLVTLAAVAVAVDAEHRVRSERIINTGSGIGLWAWSMRVLRGKPKEETGKGREHVRTSWRDSARGTTEGLRRSYGGEGVRQNFGTGKGSDERTRLLA